MMRHGNIRVLTVSIAILLFALAGFAQQDDTQKKLKSASLDGATGLFKAWDAETLQNSEINASLGYSHTNRDPGQIRLKTIPAALSFGIRDRLEVFGSFDAYKSTAGTGYQTYRILPGQLSRPATNVSGVTSFSNAAPFIDVPNSNGRGDFNLGAKIGLFSERRGDPLALALVGFLKAPGYSGNSRVLNRNLSTGKVDGGFGFLLSKRARNIAQLHFNTLVNYVGDPEIGGATLANLQNEFIYRAGAAFPTYGIVQLIAELEGTTYFGAKTPAINPVSPVDLIFGLRAYPREWISVGLGYRATLSHMTENPSSRIFPAGTNGMVAQVALGRRQNLPPSVTCVVANPTIKQGETTIIRANAKDPDNDPLKYSWSCSGGKLSTTTGDTVTFDATGVAPGKYSCTCTVSDGKHEASCTTEITVVKRNIAPTISIEPSTATIRQGESVTIKAIASDANNDPLTYSWTVNGEKLAADSSSITFGSEGRQPGTYTVTGTVSDGEFTASGTSTVTILPTEKPNQQPKIECLTTSLDVASGGTAELRARGSDPDNDRLTIGWSANAGTVAGSGETATYNAAGVKAGTYTVTATADDGKGGRASCTMTINVSERISLTREGKTPCGGFAIGISRTDNCAKAALDDIAARMKSEPRLMANVIGYTDASRREASIKGLGLKRAKAVVDYLTKKGVDPAQLKATDGGANNPIGDNKTLDGRKKNRRVEIEFMVH